MREYIHETYDEDTGEIEYWKPFPEDPFTEYSGSSLGRVRNDRTGRILKPGLDTSGYKYVILNFNGQKKNIKVHRLVLRCFNQVENFNKLTVNHKDGNHLNNRLDNLEWMTFDENIYHAAENGLLNPHLYRYKKIERKKKKDSRYERYYMKKDTINKIDTYCEEHSIENKGQLVEKAIELYLAKYTEENIPA